MKNFLESKQLQLKCLTPVHIGSGDKLNKNEYVFDKKKGIIYFLQQNKWLKFLHEFEGEKQETALSGDVIKGFEALAQVFGDKTKDFLQEYKKFIVNNGNSKNPQPLYQWCMDNAIKMSDVAKCACSKTYIHSDKNDLNDMMPFMRQADGRIYLPGSSIKGAIRTALLYKLVKTAPQHGQWQRSLQNIRCSAKKEYADLAKKIEKAIFYRYTGFKDENRIITDARADVMRGLRISDAQIASNTVTQVYRKYDVSLHKNKQGEAIKRLPLYRECAATDTCFTFTMTLEKQFMQEIGVSSIADILKMTAAYTEEIISMEKEAFSDSGQYWSGSENIANVIIGGGSGFLTKTIIYALLPHSQAVKVVREYLDAAFMKYDKRQHRKMPAHDHMLIDKKLSPRTLKVAGDINKMYHMGLGVIE